MRRERKRKRKRKGKRKGKGKAKGKGNESATYVDVAIFVVVVVQLVDQLVIAGNLRRSPNGGGDIEWSSWLVLSYLVGYRVALTILWRWASSRVARTDGASDARRRAHAQRAREPRL